MASEEKFLTARHKKALFEALEKVKTELMILGFISLTLVFSQYYIVGICVPEKVANSMLPCASNTKVEDEEEEHRRKLLMYDRRILAAGKEPTCEEGHVALISVNGLHQIHILIFFLAVFHVLYSVVTMALGRLKICGWKEWEEETSSHHYEFSNDQSRFRLTHETSFVKAHTSFWTKFPIFFYIGCFFRQFYRSVNKSDYLTLRNGFISVHLAPGSKFNFQKYIKRSLEDDFKSVVGVSPVLWASFVVFLLINVDGWKALFWASLIPVIVIFVMSMWTRMQPAYAANLWNEALNKRLGTELVESAKAQFAARDFNDHWLEHMLVGKRWRGINLLIETWFNKEEFDTFCKILDIMVNCDLNSNSETDPDTETDVSKSSSDDEDSTPPPPPESSDSESQATNYVH